MPARPLIVTLAALAALLAVEPTEAFDIAEYRGYLASIDGLTASAMLDRRRPESTYYSDIQADTTPDAPLFLDSIIKVYELTPGERALSNRNGFVVSERLTFNSFATALAVLYKKDLPVFVTSDAILHALHMSYDEILKQLETIELRPNLRTALESLRAAYPDLYAQYQSNTQMHDALADVGIYVILALSLLNNAKELPQLADQAVIDDLWNAVQVEVGGAPTDHNRQPDFVERTLRHCDLRREGA